MNTLSSSIGLWIGFAIFILIMLSLDLGLFNRKAHTIRYREAAIWSGVWISLAMVFAGVVFWFQGTQRGLEFVTGYVIELSLSVDNLFVFLLIFSYFKVPSRYQHRVLFWGVLGALFMRLTMIFIGATLIDRFHWIMYVFGAFLVYTGIKMFRPPNRYFAAIGPCDCRGHRSCFRGGFNPRDLRDHYQHIHRLHFECVRHPWPPLNVLPAGGGG